MLEFEKGKQPIVATDSNGKRIYFIGGDQDLSRVPDAEKVAKDLYDLGEVRKIAYFTRKKFDQFKPFTYVHDFGEEGGRKPRLMFDRGRKQMYLSGGDYKIKNEGIVN